MKDQTKPYYDWLPRETLGQRINRLRSERQMTCRDIAEKTDVSAATVSRVERGQDIAVSSLNAIALALGMSIETLLAGTDLSNLGQFQGLAGRRTETDLLTTQK